jgi:hypothetical protein
MNSSMDVGASQSRSGVTGASPTFPLLANNDAPASLEIQTSIHSAAGIGCKPQEAKGNHSIPGTTIAVQNS